MKRKSAQPKFGVAIAAFFLSFAVVACFCDGLPDVNPVDNVCPGFEIVAATGFPFGPLDISVVKYAHPNPPDGYEYYYEIDVQALQKDKPPIDLASKVIKEPNSSKPTFSLTLPLDQNLAAQAEAAGGHYVVEAIVYWGTDSQNALPQCVKSKEIKLAPKQKKAPAATVTPTIPAPPPQQPQPPANNPPQPTPCPPGYQGDPSKGEQCIPIPR